MSHFPKRTEPAKTETKRALYLGSAIRRFLRELNRHNPYKKFYLIRSEFITTKRLENAIAPAAYIGLSWPIAAIGIPIML